MSTDPGSGSESRVRHVELGEDRAVDTLMLQSGHSFLVSNRLQHDLLSPKRSDSYPKDTNEEEWDGLEKVPVSVIRDLEEHSLANTIRIDHLDS